MQSSDVETARVRAHLEGALAEILARDVSALTDAQRRNRAEAARALRGYIDAGSFPRNTARPWMTPVFIDGEGNRCAVAHLLDVTGEGELARRVSATRNLAFVRELAGDPALAAWLDAQGLTVAEAARVQPMYAVHDEVEWRPTAAALAAFEVGARDGFDAVFEPEARVGVRRGVTHQDSSGSLHYWSLALMASYRRAVTVGVGANHRVALLLQWEPELSTRDAQWYLMAGPRFDFDDDGLPGDGVGGELAVGLSFRRRVIPLAFEAFGETSSVGGAFSMHAGLRVGVVY